MRLATLQRTQERRRREPMPTIAPVMVCVVLTGTPNTEAINREIEEADSAQKPSTGRRRVIFWPIVLTIFHPPESVPSAIAPWQSNTTESGTINWPCAASSISWWVSRKSRIGPTSLPVKPPSKSMLIIPMVFWASLPPWPKEYAAADTNCPLRKKWSTLYGLKERHKLNTSTPISILNKSPSRGDKKINSTVFNIPPITSALKPPFTKPAPISPPISAWEELDGNPHHQVIKFHPQAPNSAAKTKLASTRWMSTMPLPMVLATPV